MDPRGRVAGAILLMWMTISMCAQAAVIPGQFGSKSMQVFTEKLRLQRTLDTASSKISWRQVFGNDDVMLRSLLKITTHLEGELGRFLQQQQAGETELASGSPRVNGTDDGEEQTVFTECSYHLLSYGRSLAQALGGRVVENFWALEMFDATGKLPDGLLRGNLASLGDFDECLAVRARLNESDPAVPGFPPEMLDSLPLSAFDFKGQHCTLRIIPDVGLLGRSSRDEFVGTGGEDAFQLIGQSINPAALSMSLPRLGVCVPSSCSADELQAMLFVATNGTGITPLVFDLNCFKDEDPTYSAADIVVMFILALFAALAVLGTAADYTIRRNKTKDSPSENGLGRQALLSFSWLTNGQKILSTKKGKGNLGCLHGIRFISMTWVVLGHTYAIGAQNSFSNFQTKIKEMLSYGAFDAVVNGTVSVDTFFLLSGLMVAYVLFRDLEKTKGRFNPLLFYLHRYIRLTPPVAIAIAIFSTFLPKMYAGPYWGGARATQQLCGYQWWKTLLYVQTIPSLNREELPLGVQLEAGVGCIGQLWYVAADMQMFIFAPFVLLPVIYWKSTLSLLWLGFVTAGTVLAPVFVYVAFDKFPPTMLPGGMMDFDYFQYIYTAAYSRAGPYTIGLCAGYLLHRTKSKKITLPKWFVMTGWVAAFVTGVSIVYGLRRYMSMDVFPRPVPSDAESFIYGGLHRSLWGLCIAWVVFACVHGYGGWIDSFLSWKLFMPLGRLTYCSYIWSLNVQLMFTWSRKDVEYFDHLLMIYWFFGTMVMTLATAFVMSLLFEAPFMGLEKIIFSPCMPQRSGNEQKKPVLEEKNGQANGGLPVDSPISNGELNRGAADNAGFTDEKR